MPQADQSTGLFVLIDSVTSEVAHRYGGSLPDDVRRDLLTVSNECRRLTGRHELAVAVAGLWWPNRYPGDLSEKDWERVYTALEKPS